MVRKTPRFQAKATILKLMNSLFLGVWQWSESDNSPVYTNWREGEPNNGDHEGEDCALKYYGSEHTWWDKACGLKRFDGHPSYALCQAA